MATSSDAVASVRPDTSLEVVERRARLRLLQSLTSRGSSEVAALLIPPLVMLMHWHGASRGSSLLVGWWALMMVMALGLSTLRKYLRRQWQDPEHVPQELELRRWERMLAVSALINGLCWTVSLLVTWEVAALDLRLFVYLVLAGVLASGTTFLAPVPWVFGGFFVGLYIPMLLASLGYLGARGTYLFPLLLLYGAVVLRHAWGGWRFFQEQVTHERERHVLAERYRRAKVEAENALAEKSWFLAAASHDLRQPLHALGLTLEAARQRNANAEVAGLLDEVQTCSRDLNAMFNDLLDLSRLEDGGLVPHPQRVSIAHLFAEAQRVFAKDAERKGLRFSVCLPRHRHVVVEMDQVLLKQMIFNLLQNAFRYTDSGGVLLSLRRRRHRWVIQVWDTGAGIAQAELSQIFSPHYRAVANPEGQAGRGQSRPTSLRSRGLGLSVVAKAAQCMEVQYGVESRQGAGSCFWLCLPDQATQVAEPPYVVPVDCMLAEAGTLLKGRCLLIDPDEAHRRRVHALLQTWGLEVHSLAGAQESGLRELGEWSPAFVLCADLAALQLLQQQYPQAGGALISGDARELELAQDEGYLALPLPLQVASLQAVLRSAVQG